LVLQNVIIYYLLLPQKKRAKPKNRFRKKVMRDIWLRPRQKT